MSYSQSYRTMLSPNTNKYRYEDFEKKKTYLCEGYFIKLFVSALVCPISQIWDVLGSIRVRWNTTTHQGENQECFPPIHEFARVWTLLNWFCTVGLSIEDIEASRVRHTISERLGFKLAGQVDNSFEWQVAPDVREDGWLGLQVLKDQWLESGRIYQLSILLVVPELPIKAAERVKRETNLVNRVDRTGIWHVLGRSIVKLDSLDVVLQFHLLQDYTL